MSDEEILTALRRSRVNQILQTYLLILIIGALAAYGGYGAGNSALYLIGAFVSFFSAIYIFAYLNDGYCRSFLERISSGKMTWDADWYDEVMEDE